MLLDSLTISFWGIFRSYQNMMYESIATVIIQTIIVICGILAIKLSGNILLIMLALVIASAFNFLYSYILLKKRLHFSIYPSFNKDVLKYFLKLIPAFALSGIFVKIYNTVDSVILGFLDSDYSVGLYAIPAKVITSLSQLIPAAFAAAIFPVFSKYFFESKDKLQKIFISSFSYLLIVSLPITGVLIVLIPKILQNIWKNYTNVSTTFILMSCALPFLFLSFATGYLLNACDRQKNNAINRGIMAAVTIILNFILIPIFSYLGAGIVFVCANIIVVVLDLIWVKKVIQFAFIDIFAVFTKSLIACIIMVGVIIILRPHIHYFFVALMGFIVYFMCLYFLKAISLRDYKKYLSL